MIRKKGMGHKLFPLTQNDVLPPLQRRIFIYLAEKDPQTINETVKALKGHYKSSWIAFGRLEKKGMIKKVSSKTYRGREYPCFWITEGGVFVALCEGVNPTVLLEKSVKVYPENRVLHCLLEISPILGIAGFKTLYLAVLGRGKVEENDIAILVATQMQHKLTIEEGKEIVEIVRKYPEQYEQFRENMKQLHKNMRKFDLLF